MGALNTSHVDSRASEMAVPDSKLDLEKHEHGDEEDASPEQIKPAWTDVRRSSLGSASVCVVSWLLISCAITLHNKRILSTLSFDYPFLLTTWHLAFATIATRLIMPFVERRGGDVQKAISWRAYCFRIIPLAVFSCSSLILGNKAYLYLSISSIQMLKATSPAAVSLTTSIYGLSIPSPRDICRLSIVVCGGIVMSYGDLTLNVVGLVCQLSAIVANAMRVTLSQALLQSANLRMDPLSFLYHFAPIGTLISGVCAAYFEMPHLKMEDVMRVGWVEFLINANLALAVSLITFAVIGKTSALTLTFSGIIRDIALILSSTLLLGTSISFLQGIGYLVVSCALLDYALPNK